MSLTIDGENIVLRNLELSDANDAYLNWLNDPDVNRYLESRFTRHTLNGLRDYVLKMIADPKYLFLAIILKKEGRHIGNIKLGPIDNYHRLGDIGLIIGEKDCWGKGYATEAISLLAEHAFSRLNMHKLTAGCYGDNPGSARAFIKAGFMEEGRLSGHYLSGGKYVDRICLGKINPKEKE